MTNAFTMLQTLTRPLALALLVAAVGCGPGTTQTASTPAAAAAPAGPVAIDVAKVIEQPLDVQLSLPGELAPFQSVAIYPRVSGFVKTVLVDRGAVVRAGQLLATLDAPELVAQRAEAESRVLAAQAQAASVQARADSDRSTFEHLKAASATPGVVAGNDLLVAEKAAEASRQQALAAQGAVESARQALGAVREMESYLRVSAPFAGVVTERNVHPGALVGPGNASGATALLRIVDHRRLRLTVALPEAYVTRVVDGTEVPFTVAAYPGVTFTGRIARVAQAVDVTTRTMAIEMDVTNNDGRLAPGTYCQVRWPIHRNGPSLFVPSTSIATTTDRTFVIRVRNGTTEWVNVRTGLSSGPLVEVFGELRAGDTVAGRGTDELRPGTSVQAREAKPPA